MARRSTVCFLWVLGFVLVSGTVVAQPSPKSQAATYYQHGVELLKAGAYDEAIAEFRRAYDTKPAYPVLYNLGLAYEASGRPVEAVDTLRRYLQSGGTAIAGKRRHDVEEAISEQESRIGTLELHIAPSGAEIRLDGTDIEQTTSPVRVAAGWHVVSVSSRGYQPTHEALEVVGKKQKSVEIDLVPLPPPPKPPAAQVGQLVIHCALPAVSVELDGQQVGTTPMGAPLVVGEGPHAVRLQRIGYRPQQALVQMTASAVVQLACDLPVAGPTGLGQLELEISEPGSEVLLDGSPSSPRAQLPIGNHLVEVERYGFVPWQRQLRLEPGQVQRTSVSLDPTPAYLRDYRSRAETRRTWSYVLGGAGLAVLGVATGVWLWNDGRYSDWQKKHSALKADPNPSRAAQTDANNLLVSVHRVDVASAVLGVAGGALLAAGAVLRFGGDDPNRYSESTPKVGRVGTSFAW